MTAAIAVIAHIHAKTLPGKEIRNSGINVEKTEMATANINRVTKEAKRLILSLNVRFITHPFL